MKRPNYNKIYLDLIEMKFPDKVEKYKNLLTQKKRLSVLEIVKLNESLFGKEDKETQKQNQRNRSYDKPTIVEILEYQKKNFLNNSEVARYFGMSRNTVASWKKHFLV